MATLKIDDIISDPTIHFRMEGNDEKHVAEFAVGMKNSAAFPPIDVFRIDGKLYVADGFHRLAAAHTAKKKTIHAEIHTGTLDEARQFSAKAGLKTNQVVMLSRADRINILAIMVNFEWAEFSNRRIASMLNVTATTVGRWIDIIASEGNLHVDRTKTRGKDGVLRDTTRIGTPPRDKAATMPRTAVRKVFPAPVLLPSVAADMLMFPGAIRPVIPADLLFPAELQKSWQAFTPLFGEKTKILRRKSAVQQYRYVQSALQITWLLTHFLQIIDYDTLSVEKQEMLVDNLGAIQTHLGEVYDGFVDRIGGD